jgi:protocatechuate 3,4-dioxygenase beta subunit
MAAQPLQGACISRRRLLLVMLSFSTFAPPPAWARFGARERTEDIRAPESSDDTPWDLTRNGAHLRPRGRVIELHGRLLRVDGSVVAGARIELSQADAAGHYAPAAGGSPSLADPGFKGRGYAISGTDGRYRFRTVMPGARSENGRQRTPHVHLRVLDGARRGLSTDVFFAGLESNASDAVYAALTPAERTALTARRVASRPVPAYSLDIILA